MWEALGMFLLAANVFMVTVLFICKLGESIIIEYKLFRRKKW